MPVHTLGIRLEQSGSLIASAITKAQQTRMQLSDSPRGGWSNELAFRDVAFGGGPERYFIKCVLNHLAAASDEISKGLPLYISK